jgi:hypothetical protein
MSGIDLATLKAHVIADDFTDDDTLLQGYLEASEAHVEAYLRRDMATDYPDGWPAPTDQAVLLLAAYFYANRGDDADALEGGYPDWFKVLLAPYRVFA